MSETRALRDKLEETQAELRRTKAHLEKLRAHQGRERESLQQELEVARREVAELRGRLQALEESEREPLLETGAAWLEAIRADRSAGANSALVALVRPPERVERALPSLSRLLRVSPADLRLRLSAMPPIVVTRVARSEVAALREALRAEGFPSVSQEVPPRVAGGMMVVRRFTLEEQGLSLTGTKGERQRVLYTELRLLMRGRRTRVEAETRAERGGQPEGVEQRLLEMKSESDGQFVWIYGEGVRAAFNQDTGFAGLGEQQGLSRYESIQRLSEELRRRAPQAVFDERLMKVPRFTLPLVEEDRGTELFADLLAQAIQEGLWR